MIKAESISDEINALKARVRVQNTGVRRGSHLIQIYGAPNGSALENRKLLAFLKVCLDAGEEREFELTINRERFSRWDVGWKYQSGSWSIDLCSHSLDRGERLEVLIS